MKRIFKPVCLTFLIFVLVFLGTESGCTRAKIPLTKLEVPMVAVPLPELPIPLPKIPLLMSGEGDYRLLTWKKSFRRLCDQIEREYPYTEWKAIQWEQLRKTYAEKVEQAKDKKDRDAFYLALREFMYSIPDANVRIETDEKVKETAIGGGYGFAMTRTDDGHYIVYYVNPGSSAEKSGMQVGAEIVQWNKQPIEQAVEGTSILWADTPPATNDGKIWEKCKLLGRAPIGKQAEITFLNPDNPQPLTIMMTAEKDDYATLKMPVWDKVSVGMMDSPIQKKKLSEGYGYFRILFFSPSVGTPFPAQAFQKALSEFIRDSVPGLIIDLRGNTGGDPELIPKFAGYFVEEETFFHDLAFYSKKDKSFKISPGDRIMIKPLPLHYRGPVVVLVDYGTAGCAEGFASVLSRQKNVYIIGMCTTRGAMGVPGGDVRMPNGITLSYPVARSLNKEGQIQIEANAQGVGGIVPSVKVPITTDTLKQLGTNKKDVVLEYAIQHLDQLTKK
ncbi:MAG TPA: S41 family peptidase [Candidatus Hydrogenedens sp.]|nr:S41 family peptidase [Candidatus Hydrogenedens sp.]HOL21135.1 S41 family peptidase [Candidatus Hydrogenedens sp.]HPP58230.1 S41 family peptidase [Candidatus Hydrogenedens sp.]